MKKLLPLFLAMAVLLTACGSAAKKTDLKSNSDSQSSANAQPGNAAFGVVKEITSSSITLQAGMRGKRQGENGGSANGQKPEGNSQNSAPDTAQQQAGKAGEEKTYTITADTVISEEIKAGDRVTISLADDGTTATEIKKQAPVNGVMGTVKAISSDSITVEARSMPAPGTNGNSSNGSTTKQTEDKTYKITSDTKITGDAKTGDRVIITVSSDGTTASAIRLMGNMPNKSNGAGNSNSTN